MPSDSIWASLAILGMPGKWGPLNHFGHLCPRLACPQEARGAAGPVALRMTRFGRDVTHLPRCEFVHRLGVRHLQHAPSDQYPGKGVRMQIRLLVGFVAHSAGLSESVSRQSGAKVVLGQDSRP